MNEKNIKDVIEELRAKSNGNVRDAISILKDYKFVSTLNACSDTIAEVYLYLLDISKKENNF